MELKTTKVYVPVSNVDAIEGVPYFNKRIQHKNSSANYNQRFEEQSLYTFTKEELERVIGNAFDAGDKFGTECTYIDLGKLLEKDSESMLKQDYINSILK